MDVCNALRGTNIESLAAARFLGEGEVPSSVERHPYRTSIPEAGQTLTFFGAWAVGPGSTRASLINLGGPGLVYCPPP